MRLFLRTPKKPAASDCDIQGIFELYIYHASNIINMHEEQNSVEKISRARIELQIMKQLDKAKIPIDYKLAWYNAVLKGNDFKSFWLGVRTRMKLPHQAVTPYVPNDAFLQYDVLSSYDEEYSNLHFHLNSNDSDVDTPIASPAFSNFDTATQDDTDSSSDDSPDEAAKAYAAKLSGPSTWDNPKLSTPEPPTYQPMYMLHRSPSPESLIDPYGLNREEGDNGAWTGDGHMIMANNITRASRAKTTPKSRSPAKPRGVTKPGASPPAKPRTATKPRAPAKPRSPAKIQLQIPPQLTPPTSLSPPAFSPINPAVLTASFQHSPQSTPRLPGALLADAAASTATTESLAEVASKRLLQGLPINLNMKAALIDAGIGDWETGAN